MDAFMFQAALLCPDCAQAFKESNPKPDYVDDNNESSYDSDDWPKGPFTDGGGESDTPSHCDHCGVFLENPLTGDGYAYVQEAIDSDYVRAASHDPSTRRGNPEVLAEWAEYYEVKPSPVAVLRAVESSLSYAIGVLQAPEGAAIRENLEALRDMIADME